MSAGYFSSLDRKDGREIEWYSHSGIVNRMVGTANS